MDVTGLVSLKSAYGPKVTMNRLESEIRSRGMIVFAKIDHAAGAEAVGMTLRPTELVIFGNAKGGTPLMQGVQTMGIDLPLKALVWQDDSGATILSYNAPKWLAARHGSGVPSAPLDAMTGALDAIAKSATS